jgi:hypothetical protein
MQMKLETNLPVIFLTLLVISIVVFGYLELKKLHERIKVLEFSNKGKKNVPSKVEKVENMNNDLVSQEKMNNDLVSQEKMDNDLVSQGKMNNEIVPENTSRVEEWQMNNEKDNIINTLNRKEEYIEEINDEEKQMTFFHQEGMYINQPMIHNTILDDNGYTDDIIEKIRNDEDINIENISEEEMFNKLNGNTLEETTDNDDKELDIGGQVDIINQSENISNSEKSDSENGSDNDESDEEINLKEINEEDDFSKSKITVDESYSVNDLKSICKNLDLPLSGNKTTLINRIMDNQ